MVVVILSVFILVRTLNLLIAFGLVEQIRNKKPFLSGVAAISLLIKVSASFAVIIHLLRLEYKYIKIV
jgi:hypothetical protein